MTLLLPALLYLSAAVFLGGMGWRLSKWLRTPVPLKIVLTPAPKTTLGVAQRLAWELFGFRSLFKADPSLWIPSWLFHVSLVFLAVGHLGGLVIPKFAEATLGLNENQFEQLAQISGGAIGILAVTALLWLLVRRLAAERVRWISTFSDYFALALLLLILATGNQMRFMGGLDIVQARQFVSGWLMLHPVAPPNNPMFAVHVLLVCALLIYIPFSKLVHIGGATLFSPTLNQRNDPRDRRHIGPWNAVPAAAKSK
jgi:respiratory nitrate reductase gamma subunit